MVAINETVNLNRSRSPKEVYVRIVNLATKQKSADFNLSKIKEDYDREGVNTKGLNIFSGGGIGASIGIVTCVASLLAGIPVNSPEIFTIVGGSLLFGVVAGFILD